MTPPHPTAPIFVRRSSTCPFDPAEELTRLRAREPVTRITLSTGASAWMVTRYTDVRQVISDQARFSSEAAIDGPIPPPMPQGGFPPPRPGFFSTYGPREHARVRRILNAEFSARRMREFRPRVETVVDEELDAIDRLGPPADLVADFALAVPSRLFFELLGIPEVDRSGLLPYVGTLLDFTAAPQDQAVAFGELDGYMRGFVDECHRAPGRGLIGRTIASHGAELSDAEIAGIAAQLLLAGYATTSGTIALGVLLLLRHPDQAAALRDGSADPQRAVEELLRHLSVVAFGKVFTAAGDTVVGGKEVKAGEYVLCQLPSANRDSDLSPGLDRFDITREPPPPHLAFGHGVRHCLGAELARMELRIGIPRLLRRFPGLRLAVPFDGLRFTPMNAAYSVESLPVSW
ncbi:MULTISPECIES: cytochrome P450 [Streptosporangium]|uniref:Cytochrome P450 n=1 Tax=Streptosporangium brasiliense TaxID=47480 RepID=A0ABT9RE36_9ACTN|nr:cytochrome P450 [Streptosporangium brasiliense]MDP9867528.1 cytochrome P450 [Streptosporangium brasiliense]